MDKTTGGPNQFANAAAEEEPTYTRDQLVRFADEHLDKTLQRLEEGARPIWESQLELGKTVIQLSSSALVLSISVAQFAIDKLKNPHWGWTLPTAWILFAVSVLLGGSRHAWLGRARSLRVLVEVQRAEIRNSLWNLEPGGQVGERFDAIIIGAFQKAQAEPKKGLAVMQWLTAGMYWSFALGLISLLAFAIKNLPF